MAAATSVTRRLDKKIAQFCPKSPKIAQNGALQNKDLY
jgi:hypothetical protein